MYAQLLCKINKFDCGNVSFKLYDRSVSNQFCLIRKNSRAPTHKIPPFEYENGRRFMAHAKRHKSNYTLLHSYLRIINAQQIWFMA